MISIRNYAVAKKGLARNIIKKEPLAITKPKFKLATGVESDVTQKAPIGECSSFSENPSSAEDTASNPIHQDSSSIGRKMIYKGTNALKRLQKFLYFTKSDDLGDEKEKSSQTEMKSEDIIQKSTHASEPIYLSDPDMELYLKRLANAIYGTEIELDNWRSISLEKLEHKFIIIGTTMKDLHRNISNTDLLELKTMEDFFKFLQRKEKVVTILKGDPMNEVFVNYSEKQIPQNLKTELFRNFSQLEKDNIETLKDNYHVHLSYLATKQKPFSA